MKFRLLGATDGHVTGSCTHFIYDRKNTQFLVDCGMVQGEGNDAADNARPFPFSPAEIKFVLLTHAHIDHCGLIPRLYREGFTGRVICTKATARLAYISLIDSVRHAKGLFTEQDVKQIRFEHFDERDGYGLSRMLPISDDLFVSFSRSAHILGSVSIAIGWLNEKDERVYVVMSGDLGNNTKDNPFQPLLAGRQGVFGYPDAIIVESTYGGRVREKQFSDFEARIEALKQLVQEEVFDKKSVLIIPAFSIQRTQELLIDLKLVFTRYFSEDYQSQSPFLPKNPWFSEIDNATWDHSIQNTLEQAITLLPSCEQVNWKEAIFEDEGKFRLKNDAPVSIDDIQDLLAQRHTYPVDIVLDSPLAREMSSVYRDELCRRKGNDPSETTHRNRKMAERFNLQDEEQVDSMIKSLFPASNGEAMSSPLGIHQIRYESEFKLPRPSESKDRGCILITGGGMCEGGPVVKHIERIVASKRHSAIVFTGYMAKGSLGGRLLEISNLLTNAPSLPADELVVGDKAISTTEFRTRIIQLQGYYSGHADQEGLLDFIFRVFGNEKVEQARKPVTIFLNHGQHAQRQALKEAIEARCDKKLERDRLIDSVELPNDREQWYDLDLKQWLEVEVESKTDRLLRELLSEQRKTNQLLHQLVDARRDFQSVQSKKYTPKKVK